VLLLQVAAESPAHFACGCLLMLSELLKVRAGARFLCVLWGKTLSLQGV
jgi:hypothetical protein